MYYPDNMVTTLGVNDLHTRKICARTIDLAQLFCLCSTIVDAYTCTQSHATATRYRRHCNDCRTQNIYLITYDTG